MDYCYTRITGCVVCLTTLVVMSVSIAAPLDAAEPKNVEKDAIAMTWPPITQECRPWAYNWWLGSGVDKDNLTREIRRYHDAGMGGIHIIPIYGAKGFEDRYIDYLTPEWLDMMSHAVTEARRLGMGVDMTTGTGWCFGGPSVSENDANARVSVKKLELRAGQSLSEVFAPEATQTLVAYSAKGRTVDLTSRIATDGTVDWKAPEGAWRLFAISQRPSGRKVKRAAPGGGGHMLNLLSGSAIDRYLAVFSEAFEKHDGPMPRAMYHDSYEYVSDWAPDLFVEFERRRGYRLQDHLDAMFGGNADDRAARVKCDYRETISDVLAEDSLKTWVDWSHKYRCFTRNQAHGSPGNLLDLYGVADIPETEMFRHDRNPLISKFASSAAHVLGKPQVAAETGTWMAEHFTETLAGLKDLVDELFIGGVNHVVYHGTCYSPDDAEWPGWLFYASTEMNPRNSIWHDAPALNAYIARCQAVLQSGRPDNDILVYWPIHDYWHNAEGMAQAMTVHHTEWFVDQSIGRVAKYLWDKGYSFDYVSDRQLGHANVSDGQVDMPGGSYRVVLVPACNHMPPRTLAKLVALADRGATVIFEGDLPVDIPGLSRLEDRRAMLQSLRNKIDLGDMSNGDLRRSRSQEHGILVGRVEDALVASQIPRETMVDKRELLFIRRAISRSEAFGLAYVPPYRGKRGIDDYIPGSTNLYNPSGEAFGRDYFLANRGKTAIEDYVPLATKAASVAIMDPMTGKVGVAKTRTNDDGEVCVFLQLPPGHSIILRAVTEKIDGPEWEYSKPVADASAIGGPWQVDFLHGGPKLPESYRTNVLGSWADRNDAKAQCFAGTARYSTTFDAPGDTKRYLLDLGSVAQSARVRINGCDLGTVFMSPFAVPVEGLRPKGNLLEIEVTNVPANRIRDLDRRSVEWRKFHDINFVNSDYQPFDASNWPLTDSGLLGPVTLQQLSPPEGSD